MSKKEVISYIGDIASILGFGITLITLVFVFFVNRKVNEIQNSNIFDKTINNHLKNIDKLQRELNSYLPNIVRDEVRIKEILVQILTAFESLSPCIQNWGARRKTNQLTRTIRRSKSMVFYNTNKTDIDIGDRIYSFYKRVFSNMISSRDILNIYIVVNENYNRIEQIKITKKAKIK